MLKKYYNNVKLFVSDSLIFQKRLGPLFWTQFAGAFNDNLYKTPIVLLLGTAALSSTTEAILINICAALFIIPFLFFSSIAGQIADKYEKSMLIRRIKAAELSLAILGAGAFYLESFPMLMSVLFFIGVRSAFFGTLKYSVIPQHLPKEELIKGNGYIEMGTFMAILLGMILSTSLITYPNNIANFEIGGKYIAVAVLIVAIFGWLASRRIPEAAPSAGAEDIKINWNVFAESYKIMSDATKNPIIYLSILGISWFWFYGILFITQATQYTKLIGLSQNLTNIILSAFCIGTGLGSMLCEKLCNRRIELGLVPFGSIGLCIFVIDLYFASAPLVSAVPIDSWTAFFSSFHNIRIFADLLLVGLFSGFYVVPLYAIIQNRSHPAQRSRAIAANNIANTIFMVIATAYSAIFLIFGDIPQLFLSVAFLNALVSLYAYRLMPEFLLRFLAWMLVHSFYRVQSENLDKIPDKGAAIIACNHVSFVDPIILLALSPRPIRFVMDYRIYQAPFLNIVFRTMKTIPIASAKEDPVIKEKAFEEISEALRKGELVGIFPEGMITYTGEINPFRPGLERIIESDPAPVVPLALQGLWGSFFSRKYGRAMSHIPRKFFSRIGIKAGDPVPAEKATAELLEEKVRELRGEWM